MMKLKMLALLGVVAALGMSGCGKKKEHKERHEGREMHMKKDRHEKKHRAKKDRKMKREMHREERDMFAK